MILGAVLLLGAPGVGKGTQAQFLITTFGIPQISTGDILRQNIIEGTPLGLRAKDLIGKGNLVPDSLANEMVKERLSQPDVASGYILDGYPRTLAQAEYLDAYLSKQAGAPLAAISIRVEESELLRRVTSRRVCPECRRNYAREGVCDVDGAMLQQRSDDTAEAFHRRMVEYKAKTSAVIDHYQQQNRLIEVDGAQPVADVATAILTAIHQLRG